MPLACNPFKILVIGDEPSDFICPVFKKLSARYKLDVNLLEFRKNKKEILIKEAFNKSIDLKTKIGLIDVFHSFYNPHFYFDFVKHFNFKLAIRAAFTAKKVKPIFTQHDVFNFHLLTANTLKYLEFIPKSKKIVLSFWGSDLLDPSPQFNPESIRRAVQRADSITLHSIEMREIFLSKYGRHLFDKVHILLVVEDTEMLEKIVSKIPEKERIIVKFKEKYNIPSNHKIVTIGHSGHDIDNHLVVLKSFALLKEAAKKEITLVLPMTYGCKELNYFEEIKMVCKKNHLNCLILDTFLTEDEIIELRIVSEIHVRTPKFDAFSLALCETFCADNIIITGAWLPYSRLRFSGAYFCEIDFYEKLTPLIEKVLLNFRENQRRHAGNHKKIIQMFKDENCSEKFYKALTFNN